MAERVPGYVKNRHGRVVQVADRTTAHRLIKDTTRGFSQPSNEEIARFEATHQPPTAPAPEQGTSVGNPRALEAALGKLNKGQIADYIGAHFGEIDPDEYTKAQLIDAALLQAMRAETFPPLPGESA